MTMNTEQERAELLPCPFCGGTNIEIQISTPDREGVPTNLMCSDCGASGPWEYEQGNSHAKADDAWNQRAALQSQVKNDTTLFCDLKTDEEKCAFFLSGRGYETGVIAHAIQNDVAMAYHRCAEYKKELETLQSQLSHAGWKEAAIAWEVCASLHREFCKGRDPLFKVRQADFVKHAEDARTRTLETEALQSQDREGWKEAAIAWEVCASLHRDYAKGRDPLFKTRQSDFVKHAEASREKALSPCSTEDKTDAERYRWLRDEAGLMVLPYDDHGLGPEFPCGSDLDKAIDHARRIEGKGK